MRYEHKNTFYDGEALFQESERNINWFYINHTINTTSRLRFMRFLLFPLLAPMPDVRSLLPIYSSLFVLPMPFCAIQICFRLTVGHYTLNEFSVLLKSLITIIRTYDAAARRGAAAALAHLVFVNRNTRTSASAMPAIASSTAINVVGTRVCVYVKYEYIYAHIPRVVGR